MKPISLYQLCFVLLGSVYTAQISTGFLQGVSKSNGSSSTDTYISYGSVFKIIPSVGIFNLMCFSF